MDEARSSMIGISLSKGGREGRSLVTNDNRVEFLKENLNKLEQLSLSQNVCVSSKHLHLETKQQTGLNWIRVNALTIRLRHCLSFFDRKKRPVLTKNNKSAQEGESTYAVCVKHLYTVKHSTVYTFNRLLLDCT